MAYEPDIIDRFYTPGSDSRRQYDKFRKNNPRGWVYGRDPPVTKWQKKVTEYAKDIQTGKYGKVISMEILESGWGDDVYLPTYKVIADSDFVYPEVKLNSGYGWGPTVNHRSGEIIQLQATDNGVFEKLRSGGSVNVTKH